MDSSHTVIPTENNESFNAFHFTYEDRTTYEFLRVDGLTRDFTLFLFCTEEGQ